MASTFTAMSCVGSLISPSTSTADKKFVSSSEALSSLTSISANKLGGRRQNVILRKRLSCKVQAMAKDLHFNKDGSAIKKLQVTSIFGCHHYCSMSQLVYLFLLSHLS